jgi:hypothetical protein
MPEVLWLLMEYVDNLSTDDFKYVRQQLGYDMGADYRVAAENDFKYASRIDMESSNCQIATGQKEAFSPIVREAVSLFYFSSKRMGMLAS